MKKLLEENKTLTQIVNDTRRPPVHPDGFHQSISRYMTQLNSTQSISS